MPKNPTLKDPDLQQINFSPTPQDEEDCTFSNYFPGRWKDPTPLSAIRPDFEETIVENAQKDDLYKKKFLKGYYSFPVVGDVFEAVDIVSQWAVCRVLLKLNNEVFLVEYEGWREKWVSWFHVKDHANLLRPTLDLVRVGSAGVWNEDTFLERSEGVYNKMQVKEKSLWETTGNKYMKSVLYIPREYSNELIACQRYHRSIRAFVEAPEIMQRNKEELVARYPKSIDGRLDPLCKKGYDKDVNYIDHWTEYMIGESGRGRNIENEKEKGKDGKTKTKSNSFNSFVKKFSGVSI